jgi:hypothetical protein
VGGTGKPRRIRRYRNQRRRCVSPGPQDGLNSSRDVDTIDQHQSTESDWFWLVLRKFLLAQVLHMKLLGMITFQIKIFLFVISYAVADAYSRVRVRFI